MLSKYALDYARHSLAASTVVRAGQWSLGPRVEFKHRVDGREYWLVDTRVAYRFGRWEAYADGLNLLDTDYQEIRGVAMPGPRGARRPAHPLIRLESAALLVPGEGSDSEALPERDERKRTRIHTRRFRVNT